MFRYMYRFGQKDGVYLLTQMTFCAQVYALADKYGVPGLKGRSADRFKELIEDGWNTPDFFHSIKVIYESTPSNNRGLRSLAVHAAAKNLPALFNYEEFQGVISEVAEFTKDLIYKLSHYVQAFYKCENCQKDWKLPDKYVKFCHSCGRTNFS